MTDLIKRLHHHANGDCDMTPVGSTLLEAADHIEQTEAKLTKAMAGLRKIADHKHFSWDQGWIQNTEARIASAVLAELGAGK